MRAQFHSLVSVGANDVLVCIVVNLMQLVLLVLRVILTEISALVYDLRYPLN